MLTVCAFILNVVAALFVVTVAERNTFKFCGVAIFAKIFYGRQENEVPRLLDSLAQGVRAGLNTEGALRRAAQETEWDGECKNLLLKIQMSLDAGKTVSESIFEASKAMPARSDLTRLRQSFVALATMQRTGGNIVRLLSDAADSARNAIALRRKAASLSAQMKLQAIVISATPSVVVAILFVVSPSSLDVFWADAVGFAMFGILLVLNVFGVVALYKIARSWRR